MAAKTAKKILFLSSYYPRECGLATFTKDLVDATQKKFGNEISPKVIAINEDETSFHKYPKKVVCAIISPNPESYERTAKKINSVKHAEVLNIQHEFGLFGGEYGRYLLRLMELVDKKIVTTLHTVLENPEPEMKKVTQQIAEHSDKVVVMTKNASQILIEQYGVPEEKIKIILHGVPTVSFGRKEKIKKRYGLGGKNVLLTFGLLSRGKGVEHVIKAMPKIIEKHPKTIYLVVGETHPKIREEEGENYRQELKELVKNEGVGRNVKFLNKFLTIQEIVDLLEMSTLYLAPSLDPKQICSGTVSYALGAGKAIIASRNKHNEEMLSEGRGIVLDATSPEGFAEGAIRLLSDSSLRKSLEKNAFEFSRKMTWPNIATQYFNTFQEIAPLETELFGKLPRINFGHFSKMTDSFGIIQFAEYSTPHWESGYTLDDNARALIIAVKGYEKFRTKRMLRFADTFLNFIEKCQTEDGRFHNLLNGNREFIDECGSEDSFGRAVWALGRAFNSDLPEAYRQRARTVMEQTFSHGQEINSPRAQADTLIGIVNSKAISDKQAELRYYLLDSLISKYDSVSEENWKWFEPYLTYNNSRIPEALFESQDYDKQGRAKEIARESLEFLTNVLFIDGKLVPIGQEKWHMKDKERSHYDQQPIDAAGMTGAYLTAFRKTNEKKYLQKARDSFAWFLGKNSANQMVYDEATGGCFDGITRQGVNSNEGAESTISYLLARLSI